MLRGAPGAGKGNCFGALACSSASGETCAPGALGFEVQATTQLQPPEAVSISFSRVSILSNLSKEISVGGVHHNGSRSVYAKPLFLEQGGLAERFCKFLFARRRDRLVELVEQFPVSLEVFSLNA